MNLRTEKIYHFAESSKLQNKEIYAGKGTKPPYNKAWEYVQKHGGKAEEWQHVKGFGEIATVDRDTRVEIHWSQCEGIGKKEMLIKKWPY